MDYNIPVMSNNQIEQGRQFTESVYATKDEVKARYNQDNVDEIWKNILFFRSFYDFETELRDTSSWPYKICLTKNILSRAYGLQTRLSNDLMRYILLPEELKKDYESEMERQALDIIAKKNSTSISMATITKIVDGTIENIPSSFFSLSAYHDAYRYARELSSLSLESIEKLNALVSGDTSDHPQVHYRENMIEDVMNPLKQIEPSQIKGQMSSFLSFLEQNEIPAILRALSVPYFFLSVRPFEFCNEETAALVSKCVLSKEGFSNIGFSMNIESICFTTSKSFFDRLKIVEKSLDLTYALDRFLAFESHCEEAMQESLKELAIKKVTLKPSEANSNDIKSNDIPVTPSIGNYALPNFPSEENESTIIARSRQLREIYPKLKKKQAHFYAGHCTIGLNYTIEQFKKEENTVYETARTSMENLADLGFYQKLQIGKKFVYTPIPMTGDMTTKKEDNKEELSFNSDMSLGE
jgi:hypothetical protein